jgi:hypothetical protein
VITYRVDNANRMVRFNGWHWGHDVETAQVLPFDIPFVTLADPMWLYRFGGAAWYRANIKAKRAAVYAAYDDLLGRGLIEG